MSLDHIPLPDNGRGLKGSEIEVLMRLREDFAPVLKRLFPSTTTQGANEFDQMFRRGADIMENIAAVHDKQYVDAINNKDMMAFIRLRRNVIDGVFQGFRTWSRDEMLALIIANHAAGLLARYPGLPNQDPNLIIVPGSANIGL